MLVVVGVALGGFGTLLGAALHDSVDGLASFAATTFRLLVALLPLTLLLLLAKGERDDVGGARLSRAQDTGAALLAAAVGAPLAALLFVVVSSIVGPVVRRLDAIEYSLALRAGIGWGWAALVVAAALGTAAVVAALLARRHRAS